MFFWQDQIISTMKPDIISWNVSFVDIIEKYLPYKHRLSYKWQKPFGKRQVCNPGKLSSPYGEV